jgi:uncharacterized protein (TIGR02757 family)
MNKVADMQHFLSALAQKYETAQFLAGDPSSFMHTTKNPIEAETIAFVASCLSFGARKQFMAKIEYIIQCAKGDLVGWIEKGLYENEFPKGEKKIFYRFYSVADMNFFFEILRDVIVNYGSLGDALRVKCRKEGSKGKVKCLDAIRAVQKLFSATAIIPGSKASCCKRLCMFMRWMVRSRSAVDLGLWQDFIAQESLIIPLDTHVMKVSKSLGLLAGKTASMSTAVKLTEVLSKFFPGDPLRGDFALFGAGVNNIIH